MFWRLALATCWRFTLVTKNACLAKSGLVFKNLFSFPTKFLCLFTFSLNWNSSKHSVSLSTNSIFALFHLQIFKKKVWVLISSPHMSCFDFIFVNICVGVLFCFFFFSLWVCFIFFFFFGLSLFVLLRYCSYANLFRLIDSCIIICWFLLPILFESNPCGSFVFSIISFAVNLVWSHWLQCD